MNDKPSLRILLLSDGKTGHMNLSKGLINWLSNRYSIDYQLLEVKLNHKAIARILLPWIIHNHYNFSWVEWFYTRSKITLENPNLIISAGGNTSFFNIALARHLGLKHIYMGSKRRLYSSDFSAHLTLEPTNQPNNIILKMPPNLTDQEALKIEGKKLLQSLNIPRNKKVYLIAIGGNGAGYAYNKSSYQQIVQMMKSIAARDNCIWLLTTSRRTGTEFEQSIESLIPKQLLADAVWWNKKSRKVMNAFMGAADRIFVTIDSMSMISETIASGKATTLLQPQSAAPTSKYQDVLDQYCKAGYCSIHKLGNEIPTLFNPVTNPAESAKKELLDKLQPLLLNLS